MTTILLLILLFLAVAAAVVQTVRLRNSGSSSIPVGDRADEPVAGTDAARVVELSKQGILILNSVLTPVMANSSAAELLGMPTDSLPPRLRSDELESIARRALTQAAEVSATLTLWPSRREVGVRALPLDDPEGVVVFLDDVTEEMQTQRIRRQFVASASHELKTPVAGLQALAEAIQKSAQDDPEATVRLASKLVSEAERMGRLVKDLLDLSRLEDPSSISTQSIELARLVTQETNDMKQLATAGGVSLSAVTAPVWVKGDDAQLTLMIRNLLDNAVRYTPEGGSIEVDVRSSDGEAILTVADTGIGIPLRAQARVFERFYRVDKDRARGSGGTGLGLSIVKHVADLHGGHVALQSELGEGSTFTVRIPAADSRTTSQTA